MARSGRTATASRRTGRLPEHRILVVALGLTVAIAVIGVWLGGDEAEPAQSATAVALGAEAPPTTQGVGRGVSEVTAPTRTTTTTTTMPTTMIPAPPPAPGTFVVAPGLSWPAGSGPAHTYTVEVETATGVDPTEFATAVDTTLADPRGWIADASVSLQRVDSGGSARIVLATPATTDSLCAPLQTGGRYSCGQGNTAVINVDRWLTGADPWTGPLDEYRHYVINHEFGHVLGHGHELCPGAGQTAPVMMQQTKGLDGCVPNGWPYP